MASAFSHAVVAVAVGQALSPGERTRTAVLSGVFCAVAPDFDAIFHHFGVSPDSMWGHRGITHSIFFAVLLAGLIARTRYRKESLARQARFFLYLFACGVSHGILDAMTTGGRGIAFFAPFRTDRYFFRFRPILVSPISIQRFFTERGIRIMLNEFRWIWVPSLVVGFLLNALRRRELQYARSN